MASGAVGRRVGGRRGRVVAVAVVLAIAAVFGVRALRSGGGSASGAPWFGVIQVSPGSVSTISAAGLNRAVVGVSWRLYEPAPGRIDPAYVAGIAALVSELRSRGVGVVLDPGLQYPPDWVFQLPGATRFRDQYGVNWTGSTTDGTAVANAVFDPAVRRAEAAYLGRVAADLGGRSFAAVRVGGLLSGELRYPPADDGAGHDNALWYFDTSAQSTAPVPGWRPGRGTQAQATRELDAYLAAIAGYERWLLATTASDFPTGELPVLLPGWGLRPGQLAAALGDALDGRSRAEQGGMLASGEDWPQQLAVLARQPRALAYTTWLDAPSDGSSPQLISPVQYLAQLAAGYRVPVAGENTGQPSLSALQLCLSRVEALHLSGMMWMNAPDLLAGRGGVTLADYARSAAEVRSAVRELS